MKTLLTTLATVLAAAVLANEPPPIPVPPAPPPPPPVPAWQDLQQQIQSVLEQAPPLLAQSVGAIRRERGRQMPVRPIRTLVASPRLTDPKKITELEEDLAVMSRLLAKDVEFEVRGENQRAMGIVITSFGDAGRAPEAMYLEGFGAFFYLNVDFPLMPAKEDKPEKPEAAPMDSDWDRARAELFGGAVPPPAQRANVWVGGADPAPPPAYEAEKVEDLKRVLLSSLRNAVNMRGLQAEDWVQVSVVSHPRGAGGNTVNFQQQMTVTTTQDGRTTTRTVGGGDAARNGVLNLRIKRADLEAYAKNKLTLEELRNKAQISLY